MAALAALAAILAAAPGRSQPAASQLGLEASLGFAADPAAPCPPGSPAALVCPSATGVGAVPGLGQVTETATQLVHTGPPLCSEGSIKVLDYPARWVVVGKGEIDFAIAESPDCAVGGTTILWTVAFTVTGGAGIYAGASGSGTISRVTSPSPDGKHRGVERWTGTLSVPGLDFDVTPPALTGAVSKTAKAKKGARSARVSFRVTAQDERDGALPVSCAPRSGSRFRIGRTRVACTATDTSANRKTATFTITVKR